MHCNQCPFLHQVSRARRSFAFISGSASFSNSKRAVMENGGFTCGGYSLRAGGVGIGIEAAFKLLAQLHTGGLLDKSDKDFLEDVLRFFSVKM